MVRASVAHRTFRSQPPKSSKQTAALFQNSKRLNTERSKDAGKMSGIFDLFGGTSNVAKTSALSGPIETVKKAAVGSSMFSGGGGMAVKNAGIARGKPKGLSMRSVNDLNISNLNIRGNKSPSKKSPIKSVLKPSENGRSDSGSLSLSPRNKAKTFKMQTIRSKQLKALSSKTKSPESDSICEGRLREENIFKKPLPRGKSSKKIEIYPEAEKLAHYYDQEKELGDYSLDTDFFEIQKFVKGSVKPHDDEGFESDPEGTRASTPPPVKIFVDTLDESPAKVELPELPSLSDDEDFWI